MSSSIPVSFPCSVCTFVIRGEYELEDFDYPVFCPKCGRENAIPPANRAAAVTDANAEILQTPVEASPGSISHNPKPEQQSASRPTDAASSTPSRTNGGSATASAAPKPSPASPSRNRVVWRFRPASTSRGSSPVRNCVAVDDRGRVLAALGSELFALIPGQTGCEVEWTFTAGNRIPGSPVVGADGTIFAHSSDGNLHTLDGKGSPTRTPTKVGAALGWASPLVDESNLALICASAGGLIRVDSAGQTTTRPFFRHPNRFDCTGALRGDVLYIGSEDQFLHAVDLHGERARDRWSQPDGIGLTGWCINSAIALDGSSIIVTSRDDHLYRFDETGIVEWKISLNGRVIGSPVIAPNGLIVVGLTVNPGQSNSPTGKLIAIHSRTGQIAWQIETESPIESTPVVGDSCEIYFGDNGGRVHAVNGKGQRLWSESVNSAIRSSGAIVAPGTVVFGLDDGSLLALRCNSQSLGGPWPKFLATASNRCPAS